MKGILAADNSGIYTEHFAPFELDTVLNISAWGATARGHVEVLKELLSYQRKFFSVLERKSLLVNVVAYASLTDNIPLAAEVINHGAAAVDVSRYFIVILNFDKIVREVLLVRERDTERERERKRDRWK